MYKPVNPHPHITHTSHPHMADIIVSHALLDHLKKKENYESPKRDNLCVQCGQQVHWCVCHLNDY